MVAHSKGLSVHRLGQKPTNATVDSAKFFYPLTNLKNILSMAPNISGHSMLVIQKGDTDTVSVTNLKNILSREFKVVIHVEMPKAAPKSPFVIFKN